VLALILGLVSTAPSGADTYVAGSTAVVRSSPGGTVADSGFVLCADSPAPSEGGACIPWSAGGSAIKVVDAVNGTNVAFQVCVDNDGNQQCGGTPAIAGCDDFLVFSHFDDGSFSNPLSAPTSFKSGCPGGFRGWVVILCQGAHAAGTPHTHEVTEGTVTSVGSGGPSGQFCGAPPGVPGKPYFLGRPPRALCSGTGTLALSSPSALPLVAPPNTFTFSLAFNSGVCPVGGSVSATGTLVGSGCGAAEGTGVVNGHPHRFKIRVAGAAIVLLPDGPEGGVGSLVALGDVTGGSSCVGTGANRFIVVGFMGFL
jgi:hypothetical protein